MDNQLPAEVLEEIKTQASFICGHNPNEDSTPFRNGMYSGFISGATEYATKLHDRDKKIELLMKSRRNQNEFIDKAIALLENVLYLIPGTEPIHDKIQTFLDGTK